MNMKDKNGVQLKIGQKVTLCTNPSSPEPIKRDCVVVGGDPYWGHSKEELWLYCEKNHYSTKVFEDNAAFYEVIT